MQNLLFVHGAAANEKSWFKIPEDLENAGFNVKSVYLKEPAPGQDQKPDSKITMADYLDVLSRAIGSSGEWILIGHSMGGMVISQFAADHPDRVKKLVYVTAVLPEPGESVASLLGINPRSFGKFLRRVVAEFLDHGDTVFPALDSQPLQPLSHGFVSSAEFEEIPRYYIRCDDDGIILPSQQASMIKNAPGGADATTTEHLDSDHFPQLSVPSKLVASLTKAINA